MNAFRLLSVVCWSILLAPIVAWGQTPTYSRTTKVVKDPKPVDPMKVKDQMFDEPLVGACAYSRRIETDEKGVSVETTLDGAGDEPLTELWEVLPVYLGRPLATSKAAPTQIEFLLNGRWELASDTLSDGVQAVRLTRFEHSVATSD